MADNELKFAYAWHTARSNEAPPHYIWFGSNPYKWYGLLKILSPAIIFLVSLSLIAIAFSTFCKGSSIWFNWYQFPGGTWGMISALALTIALTALLVKRIMPTRPGIHVEVDVVLDDENIKFDLVYPEGAITKNWLSWSWPWELHIEKNGLALYSPERGSVVVLSRTPLTDTNKLERLIAFAKSKNCKVVTNKSSSLV